MRNKLLRGVKQIGVARTAACLLLVALGLLLARFSWDLPLFVNAERAFYDVRAYLAAPAPAEQDPRIVVLVYDEGTLALTQVRSPLDRGILAQALERLDALGPKAIGIDILVDQPRPEDAELARVLRGLATPTHLATVSRRHYPELIEPWQEEYLDGFVAGLAGSRAGPASAVVLADPDGVVRSRPVRAADDHPPLADALAGTASATHEHDPIAYRRWPFEGDAGPFVVLPIQLMLDPALEDVMREQVRGRYVLIGSQLRGIDQVTTPATLVTGEQLIGVNVHATLLAQRLDRADHEPLPPGALWLLALAIVALAVAIAALELPGFVLALAAGAELVLVLALPVALQAWRWDTLQVPAFGWLVGGAIAYSAVAAAARSVGAQQRRFAQGALGRYLPEDVAALIRRDPERLELGGETRDIFVVFSDLEGFTEMSHRLAPEDLALRLNHYLETLSDIVLAHGGTLDKFVGDAVVAFWGAPIARPDDALRALAAAVAMHRAGEAFRERWDDARPGRTRVGLHHGAAVVGNFGGRSRLQYTALGDAMNTAARLEAANKALATSVLVSEEAAALGDRAGLRAMGRVVLRGRETPVEVWEAGAELPGELRGALNDAWRRFDGGERAALDAIRALAAQVPHDKALAGLVERLEAAGPGGSFRLG